VKQPSSSPLGQSEAAESQVDTNTQVDIEPYGVACFNLGCRVNRVELDDIAQALEELGCAIVEEGRAAAVVVNSCAVTGEAQAKTRKAVRHAAGLPAAPRVFVTGCAAMLFADELRDISPAVVVEPDKSRVASRVASSLGATPGACAVGEGSFSTPTGRTRPGVKVQDGCDRRCSYCIVWKARGPARSLPFDQALGRVRDQVARGAEEVVLTGVNLGSYQDGERDLAGLLAGLLAGCEVGRLRLSSVEPDDLTDEVLAVMAASEGRVAPFLHLPLQSGCDETLRRMRRAYDAAGFADAVRRAREALPGVAIACDLIVGFPGETDAEFERSLEFCRRIGFSRMHVFRYSRRPGTPAASAEGQVDPRVIASRARRMRELAARMRAEEAARRIGQEELVLVQSPGRGVTGGLFDILVDPDARPGSFVAVRVRGLAGEDLLDGRTRS
jgi:threonylcarbamoyladenosine tRNA methylthiotransferase MtaB